MPKSFKTKDKIAASNMLLEGALPKAVAAKFGVHVSTIYALQKDCGHGHTKPERASHNVTFRLSDVEFRALDAFIVGAGLPSRTAALRSLVRSATGFLELRRAEMLDLTEARRELLAQGRNLNQLAYALNRSALKGGAKLSAADKQFLAEVRQTFASVDRLISNGFSEVRQQGRSALHMGERL
jgi:hypothetical protein